MIIEYREGSNKRNLKIDKIQFKGEDLQIFKKKKCIAILHYSRILNIRNENEIESSQQSIIEQGKEKEILSSESNSEKVF